jgi:SAM-dependent methyltransferase
MAAEDRIRWDNVFKQQANQPYPPTDPLLLQYTPPATNEDARALDLAAGVGQNGLWLAQQGYTTDIMDISRIALRRALSEQTMRNLRNVNLLQMDVDDLRLDSNTYDIICVFRYLKRKLFPLLKRAIKPGGRMIYSSYNVHYLEQVPQFNKKFLFQEGELTSFFEDWHIIYKEEIGHESHLVAIKPAL